jgi:hypothetical protein
MKTGEQMTVKTPELEKELEMVTDVLKGVSYMLAGGSVLSAIHNAQKTEKDSPDIPFGDYDLWFETLEEYNKASSLFDKLSKESPPSIVSSLDSFEIADIADSADNTFYTNSVRSDYSDYPQLEFESSQAETWVWKHKRIQLIKPRTTPKGSKKKYKTFDEIIKGFDMVNVMCHSFPPFRKSHSVIDSMVIETNSRINFALIQRLIKYRDNKCFDISPLHGDIFDFLLNYDKYPYNEYAYENESYTNISDNMSDKEIESAKRAIARRALRMMISNKDFAKYCHSREKRVLLPLHKLREDVLDYIEESDYLYLNFMKIKKQEKRKNQKSKINYVEKKKEETMKFMEHYWPEMLL